MDFRARTARTGVRHFPEVIFASHIKKMIRTEARLLDPVGRGLFIGGNIAFVVFEDRGIQTILIESPNFGEQLPSPCDGFLFVVIAERPVAEHFKEGVMRIVAAHIVEIVVLARHAHTFLRVDSACIRTLVGAEEHILELHHA